MKNKILYGYRMVISAGYSHDHVTDWEFGIVGISPYHILLAYKRVKFEN